MQIQRIATIQEIMALKDRTITLRSLTDRGIYPTMGGGEPTPEEIAATEAAEEAARVAAEEAAAADEDGDGDEEENDEDFVRIPKAEYERTRQAAREQSARAKKAEAEAKARKEKEAAEQGRFRELSDGYKAERDEALASATRIQNEMQNLVRSRDVEKAAKRLGFVDTEDAWVHAQRVGLTDEQWGDPSVVERTLKTILKAKPHLKGQQRPTGASRPNGGSTLSMAEVAKMSTVEINNRWDEVQAAMRAGE